MGDNEKFGNRGHLEIVYFETDDSPEGYMKFPGSPPTEIEVERTIRNDHLFIYNHTSKRFQVLHQGSALIVNMLRMHEPEDHTVPQENRTITSKRELALFDTDGNFHDHLMLREPLFPREAGTGIPDVRHTAFFDEIKEGADLPFTIAIDDIYVLSPAKPPTSNK